MKIIVQAGGLGSRMKSLTHTKPKALIPVKNKPIIFHLFDVFPDSEFIIIGDYKYDVLDRYLTTFSKSARTILIRSEAKGNAAGVDKALQYVSNSDPVLLIWSDLILPEDIKERIDPQFDGCQIGVSNFRCSWCVENNKLVHVPSNKNGVVGFYYFNKKEWLESINSDGSFTTWLAMQKIPVKPLQIENCIDVGTIDAYNNIETAKYRCRPYNQLTIEDGSVRKDGITNEAKLLIQREAAWYVEAENLGFTHMPRLISTSPLILERIRGNNVFLCNLDRTDKRETLINIANCLKNLHSLKVSSSSPWDLYHEYFRKTIDRLRRINSAIPMSDSKYIRVNGQVCLNVLQDIDRFRKLVLDELMHARFALFHGDCQLTNTLLSEDGKIYFIDPRGYFGNSKNIGDVRYDWAKLYYAIVGRFDNYNIKKFTLDIGESEVNFQIEKSGWEEFEDLFFSLIPKEEGTRREIELIHAIIWLSLASHAWEDFDSMCTAFYNGCLLINNWCNTYDRK